MDPTIAGINIIEVIYELLLSLIISYNESVQGVFEKGARLISGRRRSRSSMLRWGIQNHLVSDGQNSTLFTETTCDCKSDSAIVGMIINDLDEESILNRIDVTFSVVRPVRSINLS